jgi:hypothetical protein
MASRTSKPTLKAASGSERTRKTQNVARTKPLPPEYDTAYPYQATAAAAAVPATNPLAQAH